MYVLKRLIFWIKEITDGDIILIEQVEVVFRKEMMLRLAIRKPTNPKLNSGKPGHHH